MVHYKILLLCGALALTQAIELQDRQLWQDVFGDIPRHEGSGRSVRRLLQGDEQSRGHLQAQAKNAVEGQLNFPDMATGPQPDAVAKEFQRKVELAAPATATKLVKGVNSIYQNVDVAKLVDRVLALSRSNILGAFPGENPFGFQADPNTFCLFAVPVTSPGPQNKDGRSAASPRAAVQSFRQEPAANPFSPYLGSGPLGSLGLSSFAAQLPQPSALPSSNRFPAGVLGFQTRGSYYACSPYQPQVVQRGAVDGRVHQSSVGSTNIPTPQQPFVSQIRLPGQAGYGSDSPLPYAAYGPTSFQAYRPAGYGTYGNAGVARPPLAFYNPETGGITIRPPESLLTNFGKDLDSVLAGHTGIPFFDCVSKEAGLAPFKSFVSISGNDAQTLAGHFAKYLQGGLSTRDGGIADSFEVRNPLDENSKPIKLRFNVEKPYFDLPKLVSPPRPGGQSFAVRPQPLGAELAPMPAQGPRVGQKPARSFWPADNGNQSAINHGSALQSVVFDGFLSSCTVIFGSLPHADGTFDKTNDFSALVTDGLWSMPLEDLQAHAGQVAYVVPAAKGLVSPEENSTTSEPSYCHDTATLLPAYNPLAAPFPSGITQADILVISPLSTVLVFGLPSGLTQSQLQQAFQIDSGLDILTLNALAEAIAVPGGPGLRVLKVDAQVQNLVTVGANILANDTGSYASFAILMYQAIAHQAHVSAAQNTSQHSGHATRRLAETGLDLAQEGPVLAVLQHAQLAAQSSPDPLLQGSLHRAMPANFYATVANATASLNAAAVRAANASDVEATSYFLQTKLMHTLLELRDGNLSAEQAAAQLRPDVLAAALRQVQLPGNIDGSRKQGSAQIPAQSPAQAPVQAPVQATAPSPATETKQQDTPSPVSSSQLSRPARTAVATVVPILGIALLLVLVALVIMAVRRRREHRQQQSDSSVQVSGNSGRFWWRSPLWGRGEDSASTPTTFAARHT